MPDDFRYFKLGLASRLVAAGGAFAIGIALELAVEAGSFFPGILVVAAGWLPLMLRRATNKPDEQGLEEWRPVPMSEVDRLDDGLRESAKLRKRTRSVSARLALGLGIPAFLVFFGIAAATGRTDLSFIGGNAAVLLVPSILFGRVKVYTPSVIAMKMPCFRAILAERLADGVAVAPYIRFDKDKSGADVPEDLRLLYELKRPPADLVGIQVQTAVNKGPNGAVPYMYAVVLTKGKAGPSYDVAKRVRSAAYEIEAGGDDEYGTVVIRQETSGGGYETKRADCVRLLKLCLDVLDAIGNGGDRVYLAKG
jgi:hypothetical protein